MTIKAFDGLLSPDEVALNREALGDQFSAVMRMAKEQNPVSNKQVVSNLNFKVYSGQDVSAELNGAFMDGQISQEDYVSLLNTTRTIQQQGMTDPVTVNRRYVTDGS